MSKWIYFRIGSFMECFAIWEPDETKRRRGNFLRAPKGEAAECQIGSLYICVDRGSRLACKAPVRR